MTQFTRRAPRLCPCHVRPEHHRTRIIRIRPRGPDVSFTEALEALINYYLREGTIRATTDGQFYIPTTETLQ